MSLSGGDDDDEDQDQGTYIETPSISVETPSISVETPSISVETLNFFDDEEFVRMVDADNLEENTKFRGNTEMIEMYPARIYDGDTLFITLLSSQLLRQKYATVSLRINGLDTPEKRGKGVTDEEKTAAALATRALEILLASGHVTVQLLKHDKYGGRFDGDLFVDDIPVAPIMVAAGHAYEYSGRRKRRFEEWYDFEAIEDVIEIKERMLERMRERMRE